MLSSPNKSATIALAMLISLVIIYKSLQLLPPGLLL